MGKFKTIYILVLLFIIVISLLTGCANKAGAVRPIVEDKFTLKLEKYKKFNVNGNQFYLFDVDGMRCIYKGADAYKVSGITDVLSCSLLPERGYAND